MKAKKGMTLIEIVISMAVYSIIALVIVNIMTSVNALMDSTSQLNERLAYEAKYADNFQTIDAQGHDYSSSVQRVDYEILYDINAMGNGKRINSSGSDRAAFEYTADYDDPNITGVSYHDNVNYRFMTFNKVPVTTPERLSDTFTVIFKPVAYFSGKYNLTPADANYNAEIEKMFDENMTDAERTSAVTKANGIISSNAINSVEIADPRLKPGQATLIIDSTHPVVLNAEYPILVEHAPEGLDNTTQKVESQMDVTVKKNGQLYSNGKAKYNLFVTYGASADNIVYYNRCVVEYNINTGVLNALKSE